MQTTGSKLKVVVQQISKVRGHASWKVRLGLSGWAGALLQHCVKYACLSFHIELFVCLCDILPLYFNLNST